MTGTRRCSAPCAAGSCARTRLRLQMLVEPLSRELRHLFERAWFFKKVRGTRDEPQLFGTAKLGVSLLVQFNHRRILSADDKQGWRFYLRQGCAC